MKLASLRTSSRDGRLVVVSKDLNFAVEVNTIATTMQYAIENWDSVLPLLNKVYEDLNDGNLNLAFDLDVTKLAAPLPRAYQWLDASAFNNHGELMARAFNLEENLHNRSIPLIYQGGSDDFLGPTDDIKVASEEYGIDFEGEVGVVLKDVPMGTTPKQSVDCVVLATQLNDVSLRTHAVREMKTGFGWLHAKPSTAFAPVFVSIDELGNAWEDGRVHLPLSISWNENWFGHPNAREMSFSFYELIAYISQTRRLGAGTILGSGTISNSERDAGSACISERRAIEMIDSGKPITDYMHFDDTIHMEMRDNDDGPLFGCIDQKIVMARGEKTRHEPV